MGQSQIPGCVYQFTSRLGGLGVDIPASEQESLVVAHDHWADDHLGMVCPLVSASQWSHYLADNKCLYHPWVWLRECGNFLYLDVFQGETAEKLFTPRGRSWGR